jgi:hypothetical protein
MRQLSDTDKNQLAYYIKIDLELYPGTTIPDDKLSELKCNSRWNTVRKSYAEFTGTRYIMSPVYYSTAKTLKNKPAENKPTETKGGTRNRTMKKR